MSERDVVDDRSDEEVAVLVVGAGVMGAGIALAAVTGGMPTTLVDPDDGQLRRAAGRVADDLAAGVRRGKLTEATADRARGLLSVGGSVDDAAKGAGLVVEAVPERLATKQEVFRAVEPACPPKAVIATNTSALCVTEVISALDDPSRALGMHFFNPVPKMRLCEVIPGLQTAEPTVDKAMALAARMGKEPIRVEDRPGFATSRLNALLGNEALRMLEDGVASAEAIDQAVRLGLNHPMGPLEMADLVGLDVRLGVLEHLEATLGERFRPTNLHRRLVAAGLLGRKSGHGIYEYDADGRRVDH